MPDSSNHSRREYLRRSAALMVLSPLLWSPWAGAADGNVEKGEKVKKTELSGRMEEMDEAMKRLRRTLRDVQQKDESLAQTEKFLTAAKAARNMVPANLADKPEAERTKLLAEYHKQMDAMIATMVDIQAAVHAGDKEKALASYSKLKKMEDKGHDQFKPDDEK